MKLWSANIRWPVLNTLPRGLTETKQLDGYKSSSEGCPPQSGNIFFTSKRCILLYNVTGFWVCWPNWSLSVAWRETADLYNVHTHYAANELYQSHYTFPFRRITVLWRNILSQLACMDIGCDKCDGWGIVDLTIWCFVVCCCDKTPCTKHKLCIFCSVT